MKKLLKYAILVVAFVASFAQCVKGDEVIIPPGGLPSSLPIGSLQRMYDWAVTNRNCTVNVAIYYTNTANVFVGGGNIPITDGSKFESYQAFRTNAMTTGMYLYNFFKTNMSPTTTVRYYVVLYYVALSYDGLSIDTDIGPASLVTSNSFLNADPNFVESVVPISGLRKFAVDVQLNATDNYDWTWTPNGSFLKKEVVPPFPNELTTTDLLVMNEWYSVADYPARFTVATSTKTNVYTQFGDLLSGAKLKWSGDCIIISMSKGSDTTLESSEDLINWTSVVTFPSSLGIDTAPVRVNFSESHRFYRAVSR